jgi:hypothetical protein
MTIYVLFQLKPDPGQAGGIVTHSLGHQEQQVLMTVDSRFGSPGGDRMVPTQVSCPPYQNFCCHLSTFLLLWRLTWTLLIANHVAQCRVSLRCLKN